jgi:hypothetical protein
LYAGKPNGKHWRSLQADTVAQEGIGGYRDLILQ